MANAQNGGHLSPERGASIWHILAYHGVSGQSGGKDGTRVAFTVKTRVPPSKFGDSFSIYWHDITSIFSRRLPSRPSLWTRLGLPNGPFFTTPWAGKCVQHTSHVISGTSRAGNQWKKPWTITGRGKGSGRGLPRLSGLPGPAIADSSKGWKRQPESPLPIIVETEFAHSKPFPRFLIDPPLLLFLTICDFPATTCNPLYPFWPDMPFQISRRWRDPGAAHFGSFPVKTVAQT